MNRRMLGLSVVVAPLQRFAPSAPAEEEGYVSEATAGPVVLQSISTTSKSGTGKGTAATRGTPTPTASVSVQAGFGQEESASADIIYYGTIAYNGTYQSHSSIPITVTSFISYSISGLTTDQGPYNTFYAAQGAASFNGSLFNALFNAEGFALPLEDTAVNSTVQSVTVGQMFEIEASASAKLNNPLGDPNQKARVQVVSDPVITFAPGFDSTGYSIVLSPGIGNSFPSTTPEPSTLVLASIGFALSGLVGAYRRLKQPRAAAV